MSGVRHGDVYLEPGKPGNPVTATPGRPSRARVTAMEIQDRLSNSTGDDMDVWAHCPACTRWYFVPSNTIEAIAAQCCPVCNGKPDRYEERGDAMRFELTVGRVQA